MYAKYLYIIKWEVVLQKKAQANYKYQRLEHFKRE
jgi:hypothetical protein